MSSIYQRKKTWWYRGVSPTGKILQKTLKTHSITEAKEIQKVLDAGGNLDKPSGVLSMDELYECWKIYTAEDSENQSKRNGVVVTKFMKWGEINSPYDITVPTLQKYRLHIKKKLKLTDKTAKNYFSAISCTFTLPFTVFKFLASYIKV